MTKKKSHQASSGGQLPLIHSTKPDVTVVLVHGVGRHTPGARLTKWAKPVVEALEALSPDNAVLSGSVIALSVPTSSTQDSGASPAPIRNVPAMDVTLTVTGQTRTVRFVEGNWRVPLTKHRVIAAFWEVVTLFPLVALLVAFDRRDRQGLASLSGKTPNSLPTSDGRRTTRLKQGELGPLRQMEELLPLLRVIARVLIGFALASWGIAWVFSLGWVGVPVGLAAATILMVVLLPLIGQVLAAAADGEDINQVSDPIRDVIQYANANSRRTLVIGHSQGGFLAHRVLTSTQAGSLRTAALIGLGSGVKPIHLIHQIRSQRLRGAMWLVAVGALCGPLAVLMTVDWKAPLVARQSWDATLTLPMSIFTEAPPQDVDARLKPLASFSWTKVNPFDGIVLHPSWWTAIFLLAWVGAAVLLRRVASNLQAVRPISALPEVDWTEITSHSDFVGRLLYPALPEQVREVDVTLGANPLFDHLTYFKSFSAVPRILAAKVMALAYNDKTLEASINKETEALAAGGKRRRRARATAVWAPLLFFTAVSMFSYGATLNSCVIALAPHSVGLIALTSTALWIIEIFAQQGVVNESIEGGNALDRAFYAQRSYEYVRRQPWRIRAAGFLAYMFFAGAVPFYSWIMPDRRLAMACLWMAVLLAFYTVARACGYVPNPYLMLALFLLILHNIFTQGEFLARVLTQFTGNPVRFFYMRGSLPLIMVTVLVGALLTSDLPVIRRLLRRTPPPKRH